MRANVRIRSVFLLASVLMCASESKATAQLILAGTDMEHRAYGLQTQFQSVGWLSGTQANGNSGIFGTATLIHPQYVLFAAHQTQVGGIPATSMNFSLSTQIYNQPPNFQVIDQWYTHPGFIPTFGQGIDLAIGRLATAITSVTPAQLYDGPLSSGIDLQFASYGYMIEYPGSQGAYDGIKRGGTNKFDFVSPSNPNLLRFGFSPHEGGPMTPLEMTSTNVGSGSGIFDTSGLLFGVVSGGSLDFTVTFAGRLDLPWIQSIVPVPEPASLLLVSSVFIAGGGRRLLRRRGATYAKARQATTFLAAMLLLVVAAPPMPAQVVSQLWLDQQLAIGQDPNLLQGAGILVAQIGTSNYFAGQLNLVNLPSGEKGALTSWHPYVNVGGTGEVVQWKMAFNRTGIPGGVFDYVHITPWIQNSAKDQMWWTINNQSEVAGRQAFDLPNAGNQLMTGDHVRMLAFSSGRYIWETGQTQPMDLLPAYGEATINFMGLQGPDHFLYIFNPNTPFMLGGNNGISSLGIVDFADNVVLGIVNQAAFPDTTMGWRADTSVLPVPEPGSLVLFGIAVAGGAFCRLQRRSVMNAKSRQATAFLAAMLVLVMAAPPMPAQVVSQLWLDQQLAIGQDPNLLQGAGILVAQIGTSNYFAGQLNLVNLPSGEKGALTSWHPYVNVGGTGEVVQWKMAFNRTGIPGGVFNYINITPWIQNSAKDQMWWTINNQSEVAGRQAFDLPNAGNQLMTGDHVRMLAFSSGRYIWETGQTQPMDLLPMYGEANILVVGDSTGPDHFRYVFNPNTPNMLGANNGISSLGLIDANASTILGIVATGAFPDTTAGYRVDTSVLPVPEPGSLVLFGIAVAGGAFCRLQRRGLVHAKSRQATLS